MADDVDLDQALDALFATPPEDFVATRNGLTKALKAADQQAEAAELDEATAEVDALDR